MDKIQEYIKDMHILLDKLPLELVDEVIEVLREARLNSRQVFIMGNGGSASTASHFVADLAKNTRKPYLSDFRVIGLTDNMAIFSAYANDEGYENVFAQQLASLVLPYDVVIGISASGNSPNVLKAMELASRVKARTIGFTGFDGGKLGPMVDLHLHVPSTCIEQVEDVHLMLEHMVVKTLRDTSHMPDVLTAPLGASKNTNGNKNGKNGHKPEEKLAGYKIAGHAPMEMLESLKNKMDVSLAQAELIQQVLELTVQSVGASSGSMMMLDENGEVYDAAIFYAGHMDTPSAQRVQDVAVSGLAGWVVENRQAALVNSTSEDPRWLKRTWDQTQGSSRSAISVPLIKQGRVAGVLTLAHHEAGKFTRDDLMLLTAVAVYISSQTVRQEVIDHR